VAQYQQGNPDAWPHGALAQPVVDDRLAPHAHHHKDSTAVEEGENE
jgi:hypothetical protein